MTLHGLVPAFAAAGLPPSSRAPELAFVRAYTSTPLTDETP